jgi:purine-binding chemotaxis protein CheW
MICEGDIGMAEKNTGAEQQLVVFTLGNESYAVDINTVKEIIHLQPVTRLPGTPPSVEGVINLRGSVIPIIDLRKRFEMDLVERSKDTRIVVVNCGNSSVGVIVDSVAQVLRIPLESVEPASNVFSDEQVEYLLGIVKLTNRLIILLDMDRILSSQELSSLRAFETKNSAGSKSLEAVAA